LSDTNAFRFRRDLEEHFWIVVSKRDPGLEILVIANTTSYGTRKDQACIIDGGEHPCIPKKSLIAYGGACLSPRARLNEGIKAGIVEPQEPIYEPLMKRILAGFRTSQHVKIEVFEFLIKQGLI
jgi:hypothetical protein